jgi:ketosteroid isomerase-like protein
MNLYNQHNQKLYSQTGLAVIVVAVLFPAAMMICGGLGNSVDVEATVAAGVAATQQVAVDQQGTIEAAVAATQTAGQTSAGDQLPEPTPTSQPATALPDPEQVRAVILNEVNATVARDLPFLKSLYAPDAVIIDRHSTPDDPGDDTTWRGWANIERRYLAFFSQGLSAISLVDLSIQVDGDRARGTHQGVVLDGTLFPDQGVYTLEKIDGQWLITQLEYGNPPPDGPADNLPAGQLQGEGTARPAQDDGLYTLAVGSQHRYEEPWGWDRGDPCQAWETGNFDDTKPFYRGFNVELLLTNNSAEKVPDAWPVSFTTAGGKTVKACYYGYEGSGPEPGETSSVTFFTVVEQGDFVENITFSFNGQTVQLCLDGKGGWAHCSQ